VLENKIRELLKTYWTGEKYGKNGIFCILHFALDKRIKVLDYWACGGVFRGSHNLRR